MVLSLNFQLVEKVKAQDKHALLIGINKYVYSDTGVSLITSSEGTSVPETNRSWSDLNGAVNDVLAIKQILTGVYGFNENNITVLLDEEATRQNILQAIEDVVINNPNPGDDVFFFYAGHGSQVPNSKSDEVNQMDETLVPTDAALGAKDIRDKELRERFNRALDRGIRLTLVFDSCHSGSIARGVPSQVTERKLEPAAYDVADDSYNHLPSPEERGALVISSAQDFQTAKETRNSSNQVTGIFSDALVRALRDAQPNQPIDQIMRQVTARVKATITDQDPVLAGIPDRTRAPLFGNVENISDATYVAVRQVIGNSGVIFNGGMALGINEGAVLRRSVDGHDDIEVQVSELSGLTESKADLVSGNLQGVSVGDVFEVINYGVSTGHAFRVYIPETEYTADDLLALARSAHQTFAAENIDWISDPTEAGNQILTYIRPQDDGWVTFTMGGTGQSSPTLTETVFFTTDSELPVFVHLPAPSSKLRDLDFMREDISLITRVDNPSDADYKLVGSYDPNTDNILYSWVRPNLTSEDNRTSIYPARTDWLALHDDINKLNRQINNLARIKGWMDLESPRSNTFPYRMGLREVGTDSIIVDGHLGAGKEFDIVLYVPTGHRSRLVQDRYVYVFVVDNTGRSMLLFPDPTAGSVGNRIQVGRHIDENEKFEVINLTEEFPIFSSGDFAVNNLVMISSAERIDNLSVFEQEAVVGLEIRAQTRSVATSSIEALITDRNTATRNVTRAAPVNWAIDRVIVTSGEE